MKKLLKWSYVLFMGLATPVVILMLIFDGYQFTIPAAALCTMLGSLGITAAFLVIWSMPRPKRRLRVPEPEKSWSKVHALDENQTYLLLDEGSEDNVDIIQL